MEMVPDTRCTWKKKHVQAEVLLCLILGFLAGRTTLRRSLAWCRSHLKELRCHIPLKNGIASPATASRMLSAIDEEMFLLIFVEWAGEIMSASGRHIAIDGKALRATSERVKGTKATMLLNVVESVTGLVLAQIPIQDKANEITMIPNIMRLLELDGSIVTTDSIGTQTEIMRQVQEQNGHFVLMVKKNQPQSYEEIKRFLIETQEDYEALEKGESVKVRHPEILESYDETSTCEINRDRWEYRNCCVTQQAGILTKTQKEWPWIKTVGLTRQIRIPLERDMAGNDITPDVETFIKEGSRRKPRPVSGDSEHCDIQVVGLISDMNLSAEEIAKIKRDHWSVENKLHHVLDDTFREDRSPAKKSKNNLALIRKFAYNILRLAMLSEGGAGLMTEMMDCFCDDIGMVNRYVFSGIESLY